MSAPNDHGGMAGKMEIKDIVSEISSRADELLRGRDRMIIAIDGRCASGKTTAARALASAMNKKYGASIFHMDDFFLRPEQRTEERLAEPGGNVDRERFLNEVLLPLSRGKAFSYRPFDCSTFSLLAPVKAFPSRVNIVEGSYCCHPDLFGYYDLRVFMDVSPEVQRQRIASRDPEKFDAFESKWIPLEEKYFAAFDVPRKCKMIFDTSLFSF